MTFDDLRGRVSSILGVRVPPNSLEAVAMERDTQGALAHRQLIRIMIAMYNYLEANAKQPEQVTPTSPTLPATPPSPTTPEPPVV